MDRTTLNNVIGLFEELIHNGDRDQLPEWFIGENDLIVETLRALQAEEANNV